MKIKIIIAVFIGVYSVGAQWRVLEPGLEFGTFSSPHYAQGDSLTAIRILRIDTKRFELRLLNSSHPSRNGETFTAREWARREGMVAAINAAMYQTDYLTSVSFMKTSEHTNNRRVSKDKTILVFEPLRNGIPPARIVDLDCDDFEKAQQMYGSAVQSIRMISCAGKNVWQQSDKRWSIAAVGTDKHGNVLFIQSTAPHTVHDFNNVLLKLPINIDRAMYMEGGSPSQMYVQTAKDTLEFRGDYSAGGKTSAATPLPNVLGIKKK